MRCLILKIPLYRDSITSTYEQNGGRNMKLREHFQHKKVLFVELFGAIWKNKMDPFRQGEQ